MKCNVFKIQMNNIKVVYHCGKSRFLKSKTFTPWRWKKVHFAKHFRDWSKTIYLGYFGSTDKFKTYRIKLSFVSNEAKAWSTWRYPCRDLIKWNLINNVRVNSFNLAAHNNFHNRRISSNKKPLLSVTTFIFQIFLILKPN